MLCLVVHCREGSSATLTGDRPPSSPPPRRPQEQEGMICLSPSLAVAINACDDTRITTACSGKRRDACASTETLCGSHERSRVFMDPIEPYSPENFRALGVAGADFNSLASQVLRRSKPCRGSGHGTRLQPCAGRRSRRLGPPREKDITRFATPNEQHRMGHYGRGFHS